MLQFGLLTNSLTAWCNWMTVYIFFLILQNIGNITTLLLLTHLPFGKMCIFTNIIFLVKTAPERLLHTILNTVFAGCKTQKWPLRGVGYYNKQPIIMR